MYLSLFLTSNLSIHNGCISIVYIQHAYDNQSSLGHKRSRINNNWSIPGLNNSVLRCGKNVSILSQVSFHSCESMPSPVWNMPAVSITNSIFFKDSGMASLWINVNYFHMNFQNLLAITCTGKKFVCFNFVIFHLFLQLRFPAFRSSVQKQCLAYY